MLNEGVAGACGVSIPDQGAGAPLRVPPHSPPQSKSVRTAWRKTKKPLSNDGRGCCALVFWDAKPVPDFCGTGQILAGQGWGRKGAKSGLLG